MLMAASFVKNGDTVCDVGCDHGKLGLYLIQTGRAKKIIATDINIKPLNKAVKLFEENGLSHKRDFRLTDGLQGVENSDKKITHVVIAGMGGITMTKVFEGADFVKDESINYDKLDEMLDYHCTHGTDSIIICGTTGESSTLSEEEHMECIKFAIERVKGRIPVIAGTGSNSTYTTIQMSKEAVEDGADGLLLVTPYYNKCTQDGLIAHYTAVAKEAKAPIILYSVASRTGVNIAPETVAALHKNIENIVAVKEASGNISQISKIMQLTDGKIDLYSGNDDQIVPLLSVGGKGVISVLANVAPQYTHDICAKFFEGDVKGSCKMQLDAIPLIEKLFCEVNPIPVKKALNLMGWQAGPLRMPLTEMTEAHTAQLAKELEAFGIKLA